MKDKIDQMRQELLECNSIPLHLKYVDFEDRISFSPRATLMTPRSLESKNLQSTKVTVFPFYKHISQF